MITLSAKSLNEKKHILNESAASIDSTLFHGRWHQVEVIVTLDDSNGLAPNAEEQIKKSNETQKKVKKQIQNGELAIITQFNFDGTFTHESVYSNPKVRFPAWRETGKWYWNRTDNTIYRKADNMEFTTLELAKVKKINDTELILEVKFNGAESKGIVETVRLQKIIEPKKIKTNE
jgi:hypothetical protein